MTCDMLTPTAPCFDVIPTMTLATLGRTSVEPSADLWFLSVSCGFDPGFGLTGLDHLSGSLPGQARVGRAMRVG